MEKYKFKIQFSILLILITFTIYTVTSTFAKYTTNIDVGTVNLNITGMQY